MMHLSALYKGPFKKDQQSCSEIGNFSNPPKQNLAKRLNRNGSMQPIGKFFANFDPNFVIPKISFNQVKNMLAFIYGG